MTDRPGSPRVAAWVAGKPVTVAEVEARLATVRSTLFGTRLASPGSAEGRNARRWVTQLLCAERIVRDELVARGIAGGEPPRELQINQAITLGGAAAAVLAAVPELGDWARSWPVAIKESAIQDYYRRNPDLYADRGISYHDARDRISGELRQAATERAVATWLDQRMARDTVLAHGFEHPADPSNPDAAHHH